MSEFDEKEEIMEEDFNSGGATVRMHKIGRVIKVILYTAVFAVMAFLILRVCTDDNIPSSVGTLTVTDEVAELYNSDSFKGYYQTHDEYTTGKKNYGYFGVMKTLFIPDADQVQVVFRYNNSTIEKLPEDYPELCPEVPSRDEVLYDISLVAVIDLTPDIKDDYNDAKTLKKVRYFPTKELTVSDKTSLHSYFRYTFENVDAENVIELYIDIYYVKAADYEKDPYGSIRIYDIDEYNHVYSLSGKDKKALKAFAKE